MRDVGTQMPHRWTERDGRGWVWLCWYERSKDPRESRSWLYRTLIGRPTCVI